MKHYLLSKILLLPILTILVTSCTNWLESEFVPLPEYFYPAYESGDTFLYKSIVTEDIDTFLVTDFILDTLFDGSITFERTYGLFREVIGDTLGEDYYIVSNEPTKAFFSWDSVYVYFGNTAETIDTTIQGFDYTGLFTATRSRQDSISEKLHKVYFDWEYGMVKYIQNNLDTYELFRRPE